MSTCPCCWNVGCGGPYDDNADTVVVVDPVPWMAVHVGCYGADNPIAVSDVLADYAGSADVDWCG